MSRIYPRSFFLAAPALLAALPFLDGCSRASLPPVKSIRSPAGGSPVLTASERAARDAEAAPAVSFASFEQPISTPRPPLLKPAAQWSEEEAAADALGRIGAPAVPHLVQMLQSPDIDRKSTRLNF